MMENLTCDRMKQKKKSYCGWQRPRAVITSLTSEVHQQGEQTSHLCILNIVVEDVSDCLALRSIPTIQGCPGEVAKVVPVTQRRHFRHPSTGALLDQGVNEVHIT